MKLWLWKGSNWARFWGLGPEKWPSRPQSGPPKTGFWGPGNRRNFRKSGVCPEMLENRSKIPGFSISEVFTRSEVLRLGPWKKGRLAGQKKLLQPTAVYRGTFSGSGKCRIWGQERALRPLPDPLWRPWNPLSGAGNRVFQSRFPSWGSKKFKKSRWKVINRLGSYTMKKGSKMGYNFRFLGFKKGLNRWKEGSKRVRKGCKSGLAGVRVHFSCAPRVSFGNWWI